MSDSAEESQMGDSGLVRRGSCDSSLIRVLFSEDENQFARYVKLPGIVEKIEALSENKVLRDIFDSAKEERTDKKCEATANKLREEGNTEFKAGNLRKALSKFTAAAFYAPSKGICLSLALANRSLALGHLCEYTLAVRDITIALNEGYPEENCYKLLERKAKYLIELGNFEEAVVNFEAALNKLKLAFLSAKDDAKKIKQNLLNQKSKILTKSDIVREQNGSKKPRLEQSNPLIPAFSDKIELRYDHIRGRYGVATTDIPPGTVLLKEPPVGAFLKPQHSATHCAHCLNRLGLAPLPCRDCRGPRYCSAVCRDSAAESYHQHECNQQDFLQDFLAKHPNTELQTGLLQHSLCCRIISQQTLQFYRLQTGTLLQPNVRAGVGGEDTTQSEEQTLQSGGEIVQSGGYRAMACLVGHSDQDGEETLLRLLVSTVCQLERLERTGFFGPGPGTRKDRGLVARVMVHFLQVMRYNTHAVVETVLNAPTAPKLMDVRSLGCGIFPSLCLLNTACDQNITKYNIGSLVIGVACKPIRKGEEVSDNYFPTSMFMDRDSRRSWLSSHYLFSCSCLACQEDQPLMSDLPERPVNFICQACQHRPVKGLTVCLKCGVALDTDRTLKLVDELNEKISSSIQIVTSCPSFSPALHLTESQQLYRELGSLVAQPYKQLAVAEQHFLKCLRQVHGNCIYKNKK